MSYCCCDERHASCRTARVEKQNCQPTAPSVLLPGHPFCLRTSHDAAARATTSGRRQKCWAALASQEAFCKAGADMPAEERTSQEDQC